MAKEELELLAAVGLRETIIAISFNFKAMQNAKSRPKQ